MTSLTEYRASHGSASRRVVGVVAVLAAEDTETVVVITKELEVAKPLAALIAEVGLTFRAAHMIAAFAPLNENLETEHAIKLMLIYMYNVHSIVR